MKIVASRKQLFLVFNVMVYILKSCPKYKFQITIKFIFKGETDFSPVEILTITISILLYSITCKKQNRHNNTLKLE
jgi:hypothetical protein